MTINNKTALVTGSSSGIGRAIALALAKKGASVIINCRKSIEEANKVAEEIQKSGGKSFVMPADVSNQTEVKELYRKITAEVGEIDILVNNASKQGGNDFLSESMNAWQEHYQQDFMSAVYCSQEFVKLNKKKPEKKIVSISSIFGINEKSNKGFMAYSAAKAALNSFMVNLARAVAPTMLVNVVIPGYTLTPLWDDTSPEDIKSCENELLTKHMVMPEEIAHAVIFLLENDSMTGQIISVDGGIGI